jgi:hypothetical protein
MEGIGKLLPTRKRGKKEQLARLVNYYLYLVLESSSLLIKSCSFEIIDDISECPVCRVRQLAILRHTRKRQQENGYRDKAGGQHTLIPYLQPHN